MTAISFSLICKKNPSITDVDDIQSISKLDLDHSNVSIIDNLELFSHIREINLSHNKIKSLKNLEFLTALEVLDLSFNDITSADLLASLKYVPRKLSTIVLSGNSCAQDENALGQLQDMFPELGIAIDEADGQETTEMDGEDTEENLEGEDGDYEDNMQSEVAYSGPVNADEVLKFIVDRKCKLQSLQAFNLDSVVKELNDEAEIAIESSKARRAQSKKDLVETRPNQVESLEEKFKNKLDDIKHRNEIEKSSFEEIMNRLKLTAQLHLDQLENTRRMRLEEIKGPN